MQRDQRQPGNRPAALGQQHVEQLGFLFGKGVDFLAERDLDRTFAELSQGIRIALELFQISVAAGQRTSLIADMLTQPGVRKADCSGRDRLLDQRLDLGDFRRSRRPFHRFFAHHVMAKGCERGKEAEVERAAALFRRVDVFGKGLPIPGRALGQNLERDPFHVDQVPGGDFARLRAARRDADAAVAHDHAGHAVP